MQPRVLGGFLVIPTADALARVSRPTERAEMIRATIAALRDHESDVLDLRADTILELRRRGSKWLSIARRFGIHLQMAFRIGAERRAQLAEQAGDQVEVLADVA